MTNAITAITSTVSSDALWTEFGSVAPYIGAIALFVFGYTLVRRVTKGASKGKVRM